MIINYAKTEAEANEKATANNGVNVRKGNGDYWLYDTYVGLCVAERERNMRDDSDFYMTVWDEATKSFKEIMFATTRAWTYPMMASKVDAPESLIAKYKAIKAEADKRTAPLKAKLRKAYRRQNGRNAVIPF
jgi:hypothetical protein